MARPARLHPPVDPRHRADGQTLLRLLDPRLLRARVEIATRIRRRLAARRFHRIVDALETFHLLVPDGALRDDPRDRFDRGLSLDEAAAGND